MRPRRTGARVEPGTLPNGKPDEAPDCYSVLRLRDGRFRVRHYVNAQATAPCCTRHVEITAQDLKGADPDPAVNALARSQRELEAEHQATRRPLAVLINSVMRDARSAA